MVAQTPASQQQVPLTASRAMRLSLARAAQTGVNLTLNVIGVSEEILTLDEMVATLDDQMLLIGLTERDVFLGLCGLDWGITSAVGEMQTTGSLTGSAPPERRPTATDLTLARPLVERLLFELVETTPGTALEKWCDGIAVGNRVPSPRKAGLDLADGHYRLMKMSLDFGGDGRQGTVLLALPAEHVPVANPADLDETDDWSARLEAAVMGAETSFRAILHRFALSLDRVTQLQVGDVLPLAGCTVSGVRLETLDGGLFASGRLGQVAGKIAVRLEVPESPLMADLAAMGEGGLSDGGGFALGEDDPFGGSLALPANGEMEDDFAFDVDGGLALEVSHQDEALSVDDGPGEDLGTAEMSAFEPAAMGDFALSLDEAEDA